MFPQILIYMEDQFCQETKRNLMLNVNDDKYKNYPWLKFMSKFWSMVSNVNWIMKTYHSGKKVNIIDLFFLFFLAEIII